MTSRRLPPVPRLEPRARAVRRSRLLRHLLLTSLAVVPLLVLAWLLLSSPLLRLDRVEVSGTSRTDRAQVVEAAAARIGTPLARVDTAAVRARVSALAPVQDVEVIRSWPSTLRVVVHERQPVAALRQGSDSWRLVDATGTAFATVAALPDGLVRLQSADATSTPFARATGATAGPATRAALDVLTALPEALHARVSSVSAATPASVTLQLTSGRTVVWGTAGQTVRKAAVVEALLRRPGRTLDVTSPNVVVVR